MAATFCNANSISEIQYQIGKVTRTRIGLNAREIKNIKKKYKDKISTGNRPWKTGRDTFFKFSYRFGKLVIIASTAIYA
jgi:hypothetical protein